MSEIIVRDATPADAPALLEIYRPFVTDTAVTFELETPALARGLRRANPPLPGQVGVAGRRGPRGDGWGAGWLRLCDGTSPARGLPLVGRDLGLPGPCPSRPGHCHAALFATVPAARRAWLLQCLRRDHPAQRGQRRAPSRHGLRAGRGLSPRRLEIQPMARRLVVAAPAARSAARPRTVPVMAMLNARGWQGPGRRRLAAWRRDLDR